jgi:hypothetical protein
LCITICDILEIIAAIKLRKVMLLQHFSVHVRCLVAIPLLIMAEIVAQGMIGRLMPQFVRSGLVSDEACGHFVVEKSASVLDDAPG